jgi:putative ABC transport system ATP-binding protein
MIESLSMEDNRITDAVSADQPLIRLIELTKVYGMGDISVTALDRVTLEIGNNEFAAIMGPSGSGKSTLMNLIGCLDRPTSGSYYLAGDDVSKLNKAQLAAVRSKRIGFVFQGFNLLHRTTALENVTLPLYYLRDGRLNEAEKVARGMQALESVGLANRAHHQPSELSGGQMQRVAIARALINDPLLVLADEPTGNLDTHSSYEIMLLLSQLHARGRTIVMVTHEHDIASYANRIIHFRDGKIESDELNANVRSPKAELEAFHGSD